MQKIKCRLSLITYMASDTANFWLYFWLFLLQLATDQKALCINPLVPSSKFPPNPLMPEIKWQRLGKNQYRCSLRFIVLSYSQNGYSMNFLIYDHDPGGFLVALVIRRCVNTAEATMETARLVEEDGKLNASVGAKLKVSVQLSPSRIVCFC